MGERSGGPLGDDNFDWNAFAEDFLTSIDRWDSTMFDDRGEGREQGR